MISRRRILMSALPPKADIAGSVDHLICGQHHAHRHFKSERLRCLEADDEFILSRKLDRQIAGPCSLENAIDVISCTAKLVGKIEGVTHEPTGMHELGVGIDSRQAIFRLRHRPRSWHYALENCRPQ